MVTDSGGSMVKIVEYDSWGVLLYDSDPGFYLPIGFAGGLADGLTGPLRFGFRDFEPVAGR